MPRRISQYPAESELEVLSILWREGPCTVRKVHELLQGDGRDTSLTTTLKTMQIMVEKGFLTRSDTRPHLYSASTPAEQTQAGMLKDLLQRAFDGSAQKLLVRLVEDGGVSQRELDDLAKFIQVARKSKRGGK